MRHIETKNGLNTLLKRMDAAAAAADQPLEDFKYWRDVVAGCIAEGLAMDETDYENAPRWFRPLWTCLH